MSSGQNDIVRHFRRGESEMRQNERKWPVTWLEKLVQAFVSDCSESPIVETWIELLQGTFANPLYAGDSRR